MISLIKQIIACLMIATLVAVACYFLPFINGLFGDYLIGFFIAAIMLPIGLRWYDSHMANVRRLAQKEQNKRLKECKDWHREDREATTLEPHNYDVRNVDNQLHVFDGVKD